MNKLGAQSGLQRAFSFSLIVGLFALTACGSNDIKDDEFTEPAKLQKFAKEVELKRNWSSSVGDGQGGKAYVRLSPAQAGDSVYVASFSGVVQRIDAQTGKKRWSRKTGEQISGGTAMDENQVFVGTQQGHVLALSAEDGSTIWDVALSSEILSAPRSDGSIVVVQCYDGKVFGLKHATGEKVWEYESQNPRLTLRGSASPLLFEDLAVIGLANGKLVALDIETGTMRWEQRVALAQGRSELERIVDIEGVPIVDGSLLFAVSYQGRIVVLEGSSGRILWRKDASSHVALAKGFGNVYVAETDGRLNAYKINDGSLEWQQEDLTYRKLSAPATLDKYVFVADYEGYIHLLSQVDGTISGRTRIAGGGVRAPLLRYDDSILVYANNGKLVSYSIKE